MYDININKMKKVITLLLFMLLAGNINAQVTVKPGVRAGLNLSTLTNVEDAQVRTDFYVGGLIGIRFADFYTLQPELSYTQQGTKMEDYDPLVGNYSYNFSLRYLSLAVMNKFTFIDGFHGIVGPSLDFMVGNSLPDELENELIGVDFVFNGGLGYTLPMGLTIEARYKLGLLDIFGDNYNNGWDDNEWDDDWDNNGNYDDVRLNSVVQLGLSYTF